MYVDVFTQHAVHILQGQCLRTRTYWSSLIWEPTVSLIYLGLNALCIR
jgi:hypothetical protein